MSASVRPTERVRPAGRVRLSAEADLAELRLAGRESGTNGSVCDRGVVCTCDDVDDVCSEAARERSCVARVGLSPAPTLDNALDGLDRFLAAEADKPIESNEVLTAGSTVSK